MRALTLAAILAVAPLLAAGCSDSDKVKEFTIHIGKNPDGSQYLEPKTIRVHQGDKVRFVITNDDKSGTADSFHDVALLDYDGNGDGREDDIEHEVPAGFTEKTQFDGHDYFVASEKGTFRIICEVRRGQPNSHEAQGMWGNFIVE